MTSIDDVIRLLEAAKAADSAPQKRTTAAKPPAKKKRAGSAYSKRYGKAFKRLAPKYKKKNGQWKKDGFKRCAAAARKEAKK
jgi:hypothetical protein